MFPARNFLEFPPIFSSPAPVLPFWESFDRSKMMSLKIFPTGVNHPHIEWSLWNWHSIIGLVSFAYPADLKPHFGWAASKQSTILAMTNNDMVPNERKIHKRQHTYTHGWRERLNDGRTTNSMTEIRNTPTIPRIMAKASHYYKLSNRWIKITIFNEANKLNTKDSDNMACARLFPFFHLLLHFVLQCSRSTIKRRFP